MGSPSVVPIPPKQYAASMHPGDGVPVPEGFIACIRRIEASLNMPTWFVIQPGGDGPFDDLEQPIMKMFCASSCELPKGQQIALLLDSPGGSAKCAYQIARYIRNNCGRFTAVVAEYAKSAATLLALGADRIILANNAELGPLDVQLLDADREMRISALDEVQALERLNAFALQAVDTGMLFFKRRSGKTINSLLPGVQGFVAEMLQPLFEKIDAVHYTQMSRLLKVAEEYAIRLLQPKYSKKDAQEIARLLVHQYPEHGFFIDREEANSIGLETEEPQGELASAIEDLIPFIQEATFVGKLVEVNNP